MNKLHQIADERVDVYEENEKFSQLLDEYYESHSKDVYDQLWVIAFRCACNILKSRFGHIWSYEEIEDLAIDMLNVLFTRFNNRAKYPDGYKVLNLPTVMTNIFLSVYYNPSKVQERSFERRMKEYNDNYSNIEPRIE